MLALPALTISYLLSCSHHELAEPEVEVVGLVRALADQLPVVRLVVAGLPLAQLLPPRPAGGAGGGEAGQHQEGGQQPGGHHCEVRRGEERSEVCLSSLEHWSQEPHSCTASLRYCCPPPPPPLLLSTPDITSTLTGD